MIKRFLIALVCVAVAALPARADFGIGQYQGFWDVGFPTVNLYRATCVDDTSDSTTYNSAAFQAVSIPNLTDAQPVVIVVGVMGEDAAATYSVSSATIEGAAATIIVDEGGSLASSGSPNAAFIRTSGVITGAASVNVSITWSEAVTDTTICVWALENLNSATETSSVAVAGSSNLALTLATNTAGGYALGVCTSNRSDDGPHSWAVLTEREDVDGAETDYTNADGATTGSSMSVTCTDTNNNGRIAGAAVAFR